MSTDARRALDADLSLAETLDRDARTHRASSEQALRDRRAVWLRLHEEHGMSWRELQEAVGYGSTTITNELRKARNERG